MRAYLFASLLCLALAGCKDAPAAKPASLPSPKRPYVEATLELPGSEGKAHVIAIESEFSQVTRCVVHVSPAGVGAVACNPPAYVSRE